MLQLSYLHSRIKIVILYYVDSCRQEWGGQLLETLVHPNSYSIMSFSDIGSTNAKCGNNRVQKAQNGVDSAVSNLSDSLQRLQVCQKLIFSLL